MCQKIKKTFEMKRNAYLREAKQKKNIPYRNL